MPFFAVNTAEYPIAEGSTQEPDEIIGGSARAFSGTLRWRVDSRKRSWSIRTAELTRAEADDLRTVLADPAPLAVSGDWFSATCRAEIGTETPVQGDAGFVTLEFRLIEV